MGSVLLRVAGNLLEQLDDPLILRLHAPLRRTRALHPGPAEERDAEGCRDEEERDQDVHANGAFYTTSR